MRLMKMEDELHKKCRQPGSAAVTADFESRSPEPKWIERPAPADRLHSCFAGPTGVGKTLLSKALGRIHVR